jgi:glycosyltransferase involved in cell wall biosynthesis
MTSLSLGFDAYWWTRGPVSNAQVMRNTIRTWMKMYPDDNLVLFARSGDRSTIREELGDRVSIDVLHTYPHGFAIQYELSPKLKARRVDTVLTHNFSPYSVRTAVFVQDVLFLRHPEWFTRTERLYLRSIVSSVRRADVVFSSSQTEGRFIDCVDRGRGRVFPVGLGLDPELLDAVPIRLETLQPGRFFLTVSRLNIRKNLRRLVGSLESAGVVDRNFPLVVVGEGPRDSADVLHRRESRAQILWIPKVPVGQLKWLYQNCAGFIFPSLGEGYGLPPLEAARFGAPLAVSDLPVLRENLGDGALYFDPLDEGQIAAQARALRLGAEDRGANPAGGGLIAEYRGSSHVHSTGWTDVVALMRSEISRSILKRR